MGFLTRAGGLSHVVLRLIHLYLRVVLVSFSPTQTFPPGAAKVPTGTYIWLPCNLTQGPDPLIRLIPLFAGLFLAEPVALSVCR